MNLRNVLILAGFCCISLSGKGQYYSTGEDPASIKWKQINTGHFQVIYPEEFEKQAERLTSVLEKVYYYGTGTLGISPRKASVVLHTHTVASNGLVAWAPRRIELFTTPNQQVYPQEWLQQLAIHEFRHWAQMNKIEQSMPDFLKLLLGQQATAAIVGAYLPLWFLEGDAVVAETALSQTGRGRQPSFLMETRAQVVQQRAYSYDKAYLGSYKDYVPNHYHLGYLMVGKTREKYGAEVWTNVLDRVACRPWGITTFDRALKEYTGLNKNDLYKNIFAELKAEWQDEIKNNQYSPIVSHSSPSGKYTSYLYPGYLNDSVVVAYRTSMNDIPRIVKVQKNKPDEIIYTPGSIFEESFAIQKNKLIWSENQPDIRWKHADKSIVIIYDISTRKKSEYHFKNKLFSPVLSPDGTRFAAVEVDQENNYSISVYSLPDARWVSRISSPDNDYFLTPDWNNRGDSICFVGLSSNGKYLAVNRIGEMAFEKISAPTFTDIKNPTYSSGKIWFAGSFNGTDNLYAIRLSDKKITLEAKVPFGLDYPTVSPDGQHVLISNYSANGYALGEILVKDLLSQRFDWGSKPFPLADHLSAQEKGIPDFDEKDSLKYASTRYSKFAHSLNVHSWAPAYIDVDTYEIKPGMSVLSLNKLGTASGSVGYYYDTESETGKIVLNYSYSGWFPVISGDVTHGKNASQYYQIRNTINQSGQVIKSDTTLKRFSWNETDWNLNIRLPLNLSKGKYSRLLQPEIKYKFHQIGHDTSTPDAFFRGNYQTISYRLYFSNLLRMSLQNLYPKWGTVFELSYRHSPLGKIDFGNIYAIQSVIYLPGFFDNHGFKIYQGWQERNSSGGNSFSNIVRMPRGFGSLSNHRLYTAGADYKFPLLYPDLSVGRFLYIKRIKTSLFYDYSYAQIPAYNSQNELVSFVNRNYRSVGLELTSDMHLLRFFAPFEFGIRTSWLPQFNSHSVDFLLAIDLNAF